MITRTLLAITAATFCSPTLAESENSEGYSPVDLLRANICTHTTFMESPWKPAFSSG